MVTCPHALASAAGVEMLRAGGSAVDAAIAASAVLSVVYPHMTSVGGDAFWLIHAVRDGGVRFLDAGGRAPAAASIAAFQARGLAEIPYRGVLPATVTVPGAVDGWLEAHAAHGRLPLPRLLAPAIEYARDGFPVTARLVRWIGEATALLAASPEAAAIFLPDGRPPRAGQRLRNPDLARTLEAVAGGGRRAFYEGEVAREIVRWSRAHDGLVAEEDFRAQRAGWGEPLAMSYRGVTLYETPPPTQGLSVLQMLQLIEPFDVGAMDYLGPDHVHLLVQAKQLAFHDRDRVLADPDFVKVPVERLLSPAYAEERRRLIDMRRALPWDEVPSTGSLTGDTVYVAAVDADGNAASLIHSLYGVFGAGVVAGRTGIVLQNRGAYFSLGSHAPEPSRAGQAPAAHPDRLAGLSGRPALAGAWLHGRRRPAPDPPPGLYRDDRLRPRRPAGGGGAAVALRPLRAARAPRPPQHGRAVPGADLRRARPPRPPHQPVGGVERAGGPRPRDHGGSGDGHAPGRLRSPQRRRRHRVLTGTLSDEEHEPWPIRSTR
jgi:gamma-glutamyltranspeptidase